MTMTVTERTPDLSDEQFGIYRSVIADIRERKKQSVTIAGLAGTGKTWLGSALADALLRFLVLAPTNKATAVLRRKGVQDAATIHSRIYYTTEELKACTIQGPDGKPRESFRTELKFQRRFELPDAEGILVDEASMVGKRLHQDLMSFGLPVIFLGDSGQLPPVSDDDSGLMASPDYELTQIHRNAGEIARFAHHLRQGHDALDFESSPNGVMCLWDQYWSSALEWVVDRIGCGFRVITASNPTRVQVNQVYLRSQRRRDLKEIRPGDRLLAFANHRDSGIRNGTELTVESVTGTSSVVARDENGRSYQVTYDPDGLHCPRPSEFRPSRDKAYLDFGFAMTAHKAQGSEWDYVIVLDEDTTRWAKWEPARWNYTAATRASKRLEWLRVGSRHFTAI